MKFIFGFKKKIQGNPLSSISLLIGLQLLLIPCAFSQSVYVPLNHRVYDFIERLETKGFIKGTLTETKPLTRQETASYLFQLHTAVEHGLNLTKVELDQLNFLNIEFNEELQKLKEHLIFHDSRINSIRENKYIGKIIPHVIYRNDRNFLSWQQPHFQIYIDPILYYSSEYNYSDTLQSTEKIFHFTNGARFYGYSGDHLGFLIDARDNKDWGTRKYQIGNYTLPGLGFVRATSPDFIYHDETEAYIKLGFKYIDLTYGKFRNYWGPGYTGSLILSDNATSYDQFKLEINYNKFKFTSVYAFLIDYKDFKSDSLQGRKYLAGHRLEFTPWNWLTIGLSEVVVFAGRDFEPSYLNPVMFYRSAEHYLGSPDNMMLGADFKCFPIKNIKLYGELLIDDITTSNLGTNWYGNKLGFLSGIFFADPLTLDNLDVRIEYIRLRPYVYTHENSLEYTHYGTSLGHNIGPNSDLLGLFFNYQFTMRLTLSAYYKYLRHGRNTPGMNFGGDIQRYFVHGNDEYPAFLGGLKDKNHVYCVGLSYELIQNLFVIINYSYHQLHQEKRNADAHNLFFSFGINY